MCNASYTLSLTKIYTLQVCVPIISNTNYTIYIRSTKLCIHCLKNIWQKNTGRLAALHSKSATWDKNYWLIKLWQVSCEPLSFLLSKFCAFQCTLRTCMNLYNYSYTICTLWIYNLHRHCCSIVLIAKKDSTLKYYERRKKHERMRKELQSSMYCLYTHCLNLNSL